MKILHLAMDEKFVPFAQDVWERAFPASNEFRVMPLPGAEARFAIEARGVRFVATDYWFSRALRHDLQAADFVVVHFMSHWFSRAILRAPRSLPIVWHGWGADYYELLDGYSERLYLPLTKALRTTLGERRPNAPGPRDFLRRLTDFATNRLFFRDWMRRVLERIDVISMLPAEFELLKRSQSNVRAVFHQLYCSSVEETFLESAGAMSGPDLLLGNSATATNNHLDAFETLRRLDLGERNIVTPLSYGSDEYADAVRAEGKRLFGSRFVPLSQFLAPAEFAARIANCGFVFMNHVRQQATGTVSQALARGAKVFLREENLLYPFYRAQGAHIQSFPGQNEDPTGRDTFAPLTDLERSANRRVILEYWSKERIIEQTRALETVVRRI